MSKFKAVFDAVNIFDPGGIKGLLTGGKKDLKKRPPAVDTAETKRIAVEAARKRTLEAAKLRTGRRKSILTSPRGAEDALGVVQPKAGGTNRQAQLFGA